MSQHTRRRHADDKPFSCSMCSYTCADLRNLRSHLLKHVEDEPWQCTECENSFRCKDCLKSYTSSYNLKYHLKKCAIPENPVHQSDSQTASAEDYVIQNHSASTEEHLIQNQAPIRLGISGTENHSLKKSRKEGHHSAEAVVLQSGNTKNKGHSCIVCKKIFRREGRLRVHMRKHTRKKPHKCPACEECFRRMCRFKSHLLSHLY